MLAFYAFVFVFGLVVGSFVNVLIYRVPECLSIITPPSSCVYCGKKLAVRDLVPVLSYVFLKGRCRYCGGAFRRDIRWWNC